MTSEILNTSQESEIVSTRVFSVPIEKLFKAWSEPKHLIKWWGPKGFSNTFQEFDFKVGGKWRFVMHGPEKGHYPNECEFIKIETPHLIAWNRISKPHFQVLVLFEFINTNKTKLIFKMLFETEEACAKLRPFVLDKNEENFDKLEVVLGEIK